jgi:hypothetical protein
MPSKTTFWEKVHTVFGHFLVIIAIVLVVTVFGGAYYFIIAPNMISKPVIEQPELPANAMEKISSGEKVINETYLNYIANEIGGYKLHAPIGNSKDFPIIEFMITDINEQFYSYVKGHVPIAKQGNPKNEDIIIKGDQETVASILESGNIPYAVREANNNGKINVELSADMKILAAKGYLSLYDAIK